MYVSFQVNAILLWVEENIHERVLYIDPANQYIVVIDIFNCVARPVVRSMEEIQSALDHEFLIKLSHDPFASLSSTGKNLSEKQQEKWNAAWNSIKELIHDEPNIYASEGRKNRLEEHAATLQISRKTLFKRLRRYWQRGMVKYALLPDFWKCGAPGRERLPVNGVKLGRPSRVAKEQPELTGVNMSDETKQVFRHAIKRFFEKPTKMPLTRAYALMCEQFFRVSTRIEKGIPVPVLPHSATIPTFWQFKYFHSKNRNLENELKSREGERRFNLRHRAVLGESTSMAFGPGSIYQIDATVGDIYLISELNASKIIGRPVIYTVKDVFSRMIAGLYVGLEGPSWVGAMMALANAMSDKVSFCADYEFEITAEDWPCTYLPQAILADRGEVLSRNADLAVRNLGIRIDNTPPYRADWKGIIEQYFRLANLEVIHWLPGAVKERMRERGERDYRLDAVYTLQEFTSLLIGLALFHNLHHRMKWYRRDEFQIMDDVEPVPIHLWRWGIENRLGILRELDSDLIKLNLLPQTKASVTREGIRINGLYYSCERALAEQWFTRARHSGVAHLTAAYDPRKPDIAYLCLNGGRSIELCNLLPKDQRFANYWIEEFEEFKELDKLRFDFSQVDERQARTDLHARITHKTKQAEQRKGAALLANPLSDAKRTSKIRENRADERALVRKNEAWNNFEQSRIDADSEASPVEPAICTNAPTLPPTASDSPTQQPTRPEERSFDRKSSLLSLLEETPDDNC